MDKAIYILIGVAIVLAIAAFLFLNFAKPPETKVKIISEDPCLVSGIKVCDLGSRRYYVDWKLNDPNFVGLYKSGRALIFQACTMGGGDPETNYDEARKKIAEKVSDFLGTVVKSVSVLRKVNDAELYSSVTQVFTPEKLIAGIVVISKYRYVRLGIDHYCVVAYYDPQRALEALKAYSQLLNVLKEEGISWEEFEKEFKKAMEEIYGR